MTKRTKDELMDAYLSHVNESLSVLTRLGILKWWKEPKHDSQYKAKLEIYMEYDDEGEIRVDCYDDGRETMLLFSVKGEPWRPLLELVRRPEKQGGREQ